MEERIQAIITAIQAMPEVKSVTVEQGNFIEDFYEVKATIAYHDSLDTLIIEVF